MVNIYNSSPRSGSFGGALLVHMEFGKSDSHRAVISNVDVQTAVNAQPRFADHNLSLESRPHLS